MGLIKNKIRLLALIVPVFLVVFSIVPAGAQNQGSGLSISPTVSEYSLRPGQTGTISISLKNITGGDITAQPSVYDFVSDNESGTPRIITDASRTTANSIKKFITGLQDIPLSKGEQKRVPAGLLIPQDTPPGAYYGIIRYKSVPSSAAGSQKPGEVALSASVGTIVLITVPGNLREQVQLAGVHVYAKNNRGTFFTKKPDQVGVEVKNLGNGFAQPFGTVEIRSTFGAKAYSYQLNNTTPRSNVLPSSSRIFKEFLKNTDKPGRYTVTASVAYGNGSNVLVGKKTFWYIPVWLITALLGLVVVLIFFTLRFRRRHHVVSRKTTKKSR